MAVGFTDCNTTGTEMVFHDKEWERTTPESQKVDEAIMLEALEYLKSKSFEGGNDS